MRCRSAQMQSATRCTSAHRARISTSSSSRRCEKWSMPIIVWSYPRGDAIERKGGRDSLYAVEYAARVAHELGADIIKLNMPKKGKKDPEQPKPYDTLEWDEAAGVRRVVEAAGRSLVLFSGGSKLDD